VGEKFCKKTVSGCVSDALKTLTDDKFLISTVQVIDDYRHRRDKLLDIWYSVPRDPTKYYEKT